RVGHRTDLVSDTGKLPTGGWLGCESGSTATVYGKDGEDPWAVGSEQWAGEPKEYRTYMSYMSYGPYNLSRSQPTISPPHQTASQTTPHRFSCGQGSSYIAMPAERPRAKLPEPPPAVVEFWFGCDQD